MKRALSPLVVPLAALTLTACGGGHNHDHVMSGHSMADHSMDAGTAPATAGHNAQDVRFAQMMIPHHRQAIVMAETEQARGSAAEAKAMAGSIVTSQSAEITTMRKLLN
jgi:uncharacterized protein (DUF305 family)